MSLNWLPVAALLVYSVLSWPLCPVRCLAQEPTVTLSSSQPDATLAVTLTGSEYQEFSKLSPAQLSDHLRLYVQSSYREGAGQAMLGEVQLHADRLAFRPRFALERGLEYLLVFRRPGSQPLITRQFALPKPVLAPSTTVTQIYPTAEILPQNLLKFYIVFSAPMSQGDVYQYISLTTDDGRPLFAPFLEIEQELWDKSGKRLTLLLDPGRVKRGLVPHDEDGAILTSGQRYRLMIDARWPDATGVPLAQGATKKFLVAADDYVQPNPALWKITPPKARTQDPLVIEMPEPIDHATFIRGFTVENHKGETIRGEVTFAAHETRVAFTPLKPWRSGLLDACFSGLIEDLAGNSIERPFEVDRFDQVIQPSMARKQLTFEIQ